MKHRETIEIQKELHREGGKVAKYQDLILGCKSLPFLIKYELIIGIASWVPGAFGLLLRSKLYPKLLGYVGRNVTFGCGVVLRHPKKIFIGDNVVVDDQCVLDAKGQSNHGIFIGDGVFLGRNTILNCKNGDIILEDRVNIGFNSMIFSASSVRVGEANLIAAYCYLVGGNHHFDDPNIPVLDQPRESKGITMGSGGWLGAHVTIFDGVHVGKHCIIAAGSVVNKNLDDYAIAGGTPARMIRKRDTEGVVPRIPKSVTVGIVNYNGEAVLEETIRSVQAQDYANLRKIIVSDDGSKDGSVSLVREKFPDVQIIAHDTNRGPNAVRNAVLREADTDLVLLMDNDILLEKSVITLLEDALHRNPDAGIASAQIRLHHSPETIQYNGVHVHYVAGASMNRLDLEKPVRVGAVSGGTILIDRAKALEIGLFDEDFFSGWEDGDFTFRMHISGYPVLNVSKARVYHKQEGKGLGRLEYQVRNRWWFIYKNYNARTIAVLMPALLINQIALFVFAMLKGQLGPFFKGNWEAFITLPQVLKKRKSVLAGKRLKDKRALSARSVNLLGYVEQSKAVRLGSSALNGVYSLYWMAAKYFID